MGKSKTVSQLLSDGEQPATEDSRNWLQYSSGLHWGSPQTGCQRLQTASSMPLTLPAHLDSLDHVAQKAELLGWQPGLSFWAPAQNQQIFRSLSKKYIYIYRVYVVSKIQKDALDIVFLF